jgi:hypothetical protein
MLNKKAILVSGFSRGGTNILWNVLQSHPKICSARYETNGLFNSNNVTLKYLFKFNRIPNFEKINVLKLAIDYKLYNLKMTNHHHRHNKFAEPGIIYTKKQVSNSAICFKSVDNDINYTKDLRKIYPNLYFIALTRNGYALIDGHKRRGSTVQEVAKLYQNIADKMQEQSEKLHHFKLVRFENIINDTFSASDELFKFLKTEPYDLKHIRLKSKKIVGKDGLYHSKFGSENEKYWFNKKTIKTAIDNTINDRQMSSLSSSDIKTFNKYAKSALNYFGYRILN